MPPSPSARFAVGATVLLLVLFLLNIGPSTVVNLPHSFSYSSPRPRHSKNAFCVFLAEPNDAIKDHQEDYYFMGTRMLIYQTLHDPDTRTNTSIPFVVLVTENVPRWKRDRLTLDGAQVLEVSEIKIDWIKPGRPRWQHVMDKLHVFELIQFDKVLLLDSDVVVVKRLDPIFDSHSALPNLNNASYVRADESTQPSHYLMAGNCGPPPPPPSPSPSNSKHDNQPTPQCHRLNAGFVLLQPSLALFEHYLSVAKIKGRFPGGSPEQDLWNYVHRPEGNMPWTQVDRLWNVNSPSYADYAERDVASLHEKYWRCDRDLRLRDVLLRSRWKAEGFFASL